MKDVWETAAPFVHSARIALTDRRLPETFEFEPGVGIGRLPDWARSKETAEMVARVFGQAGGGDYWQYGFFARSVWEGGVVKDEEDAMRRRPDYLHRDRFALASVALWLARPTPVAYRIVMDLPEPLPDGVLRTPLMQTHRACKPLPTYADKPLTRNSLAKARRFYRSIRLVPRPSPVFSAVRGSFLALQTRDWSERTFLCWMSIEALFAPPFKTGHATEKLLSRLRHYLDRTASATRLDHQTLADLYAERSDVVHGARFAAVTNRRALRTTRQAEEVLRLALRAVLARTAEVALLNGPNREGHLSSLPPRPKGIRGRAWRR